ncbi:hypothetical protein Tco_0359322, partial [Tanacetum coccineum]
PRILYSQDSNGRGLRTICAKSKKGKPKNPQGVSPRFSKIHDVIKKEVEKLLDAGLIYPISDSPWVSPVHCVPKKGGMTVITNDENELIPTRLVTGWRVCIDYRKLNEATRKDHFPLPFMDQMLDAKTSKRRKGGGVKGREGGENEYSVSSNGFSGLPFRFQLTQKIRKRQPSHAHTEHLPIVACLLGYAMHLWHVPKMIDGNLPRYIEKRWKYS